MISYTTEQGDTFDLIAKKCYDNELMMGKIIDANPKYNGVMVFPSGILLSIPDTETAGQESSTVPPWRQTNG